MIYYSPRRFSLLYDYVRAHGKEVNSVRGNTIELVNASFIVRNPRDRLITEPWRKINFPFAVAEWISLLNGNDDVETFKQFIKGYGEYSTDGKTVDGAYGPRTIYQIEPLIQTLRDDPDSRRAVMTIYQQSDLVEKTGGLNTPCTLSLQFLIREGKLVMITNMRSNDLFFGLGHDLIVFTMLQEYIAARLGIEMGEYHHNAGSLHIYERHLDENVVPDRRWNLIMRPMQLIDDVTFYNFAVAYKDVKAFTGDPDFGNYLNDLFYAARCFVYRNDDEEISRSAYWSILDYTIRRVMRPWLKWYSYRKEE